MQTQHRGHAPQSASRSVPRPAPTQCFSVQALADPGTLPRVLEVFAKRGLVPARVHASRASAAKGDLVVDIQLDDTGTEQARLIAQELRRQFCVDAVLVAEKLAPAPA